MCDVCEGKGYWYAQDGEDDFIKEPCEYCDVYEKLCQEVLDEVLHEDERGIR